MTRNELIIYTVGMLAATNLFGIVYSYVVLNTSLFKKYRIQEKEYQPNIFKARFGLYFLNLVMLLAFSAGGVYFIFDLFDTTNFTFWIVALQVFIAFVMDDFWFYFMHRYFHENKFLLRKIHSIHHRAHTPFPMEYLYGHPLEWMSGTIGVVLGFAVIYLVFGSISVFAFLAFGFLRNLHEIHIHSDLELPIVSKIPFLSKTRHHDDHHSKLDGNYSSTFTWMDRIFKTTFRAK
jgi:4-alpha-methyl-delta7-sterol-4alpha-methyl oxidase